ncbi:MAG: hypothetical protein O3B47_04315, partial [bacterium]|nr:hypothetical protein [bacterium]
MPEALRADDEPIKTPEQDSEEQDSKQEPSINENKLSKNEVRQLKDGKVTITQLANKRLQLKTAGEAELNKMVVATREHGNLINLKE